MTTPSASSLKNYLSKLRAVTDRWYAQVLLYLVLVVVFFVIDQLIVADLYFRYFHAPGTVFNWLFLTGDWIPGFANAIVIVVFVRARTFFAYSIIVALITCVLAIAYYYLADLYLIYSHDPMGLGSEGLAIIWGIVWFCGGLVGLTIKLVMRK